MLSSTACRPFGLSGIVSVSSPMSVSTRGGVNGSIVAKVRRRACRRTRTTRTRSKRTASTRTECIDARTSGRSGTKAFTSSRRTRSSPPLCTTMSTPSTPPDASTSPERVVSLRGLTTSAFVRAACLVSGPLREPSSAAARAAAFCLMACPEFSLHLAAAPSSSCSSSSTAKSCTLLNNHPPDTCCNSLSKDSDTAVQLPVRTSAHLSPLMFCPRSAARRAASAKVLNGPTVAPTARIKSDGASLTCTLRSPAPQKTLSCPRISSSARVGRLQNGGITPTSCPVSSRASSGVARRQRPPRWRESALWLTVASPCASTTTPLGEAPDTSER
eukprot:scaffold132762_cov30-Tisochrysis_lutea.AAC.2